MTTETPPAGQDAPRLSDQQMTEIMELVKGADTVELKLTVPSTFHRGTIQGLGLDPVEAQPRQVYFFETPDLALNEAGVVVRARRIQGGRADTVVKLRPVVPAELPDEVRRSTSFNVEVDIIPGGYVCSASFKGRSTNEEVSAAVAGETPLRKVFSKDQRAFYDEHAPAGIDIDSLVPLGPTFVLKAAFTPEEFGRRIVAEMWLYPDGSRILELSTKCVPNEAFQVAGEARGYLSKYGIPIASGQQTKTKAALEFYKGQLTAGDADEAAS